MASSDKKREWVSVYEGSPPGRKRQKTTDEKPTEEARLAILPKEIKNQIGNFLDDRSKRRMRATSAEWFHIIDYDDFTIYFARPSTLPSLLQTFQRYSKPIGLKFEKTICLNSSFTELAALTHLTRLEIDPQRSYRETPTLGFSDQLHFTKLTALQHLSFPLQEYSALVFDNFQNLTHIDFRVKAMLRHPDFVPNPKINIIQKLHNATRLKSLVISDFDGILEFDTESVSKMSNLSKLSIYSYDTMFPFSKLPNLEYLSIESDTFDDFSLLSTKLTYLSIRGVLNGQRLSMSHLTRLRALVIQTNVDNKELGFLTALTNLERIVLHQNNRSSLKLINSSKLTSFVCGNQPGVFEYITHLTSIQSLVVSSADRDSPVMFTNVTQLRGNIAAIKYCPNVRDLVISESLNSPAAHQLQLLSQLESLMLIEAKSTAVSLMTGLVNLTRLNFRGLATDTNYESLKNLTALKEIELNYVNTQAGVPPTFADFHGLSSALRMMTNLEELTLIQIALDNDAVQALEALPNLKQLCASYIGAGDFDEAKLSNLTNLQQLKLQDQLNAYKYGVHRCSLTHLSYLYNCQDYL